MENETSRTKKSLGIRVWNFFKIVLAVSIISIALESLIDLLPWKGWEEFSQSARVFDSSIQVHAYSISPLMLYEKHLDNRHSYRYGWYFYKASSPFNISMACMNMRKKVLEPTTQQNTSANSIDLNTIDTSFNPLVVGSGISKKTFISRAIPLRKNGYVLNQSKFDLQPAYLQKRCNCNPSRFKNLSDDSLYYSSIVLKAAKNDDSLYPPGWVQGILGVPHAFILWFKENWHNQDGSANYVGRLLLIIAGLLSIITVSAKMNKQKMQSALAIPFLFLRQFLIMLSLIALVALAIFLLLEIIRSLGNDLFPLTGLSVSMAAFTKFITTVVKETSSKLESDFKEGVAHRWVNFIFKRWVK